ncbi:MAG: hypothetical protein HW383_51 [Candidatus Magasanikbacteria bacterium]|nr:hypothetical protein [Candidatus Magasanikbacteria bacterium]
MKNFTYRLVTLGVVASMALVATPALAQDTASTVAPVVTTSSEVVKAPRHEVRVDGELTAISGNDLTVKAVKVLPKNKKFEKYPQKDGTVIVHLTDKTVIVRKYWGRSTLAELEVGDQLVVFGKLNNDGAMNARHVRDLSIYKLFRPAMGKVESVDAVSNKFMFSVKDKSYVVFVTASTRFTKRGQKPTFTDLKVGDDVQVRGVFRKAINEVLADNVQIKAVKPVDIPAAIPTPVQ